MWTGCFRYNWDVLGMLLARLGLVKPEVPGKTYRSSKIVCVCIRAIPAIPTYAVLHLF